MISNAATLGAIVATSDAAIPRATGATVTIFEAAVLRETVLTIFKAVILREMVAIFMAAVQQY